MTKTFISLRKFQGFRGYFPGGRDKDNFFYYIVCPLEHLHMAIPCYLGFKTTWSVVPRVNVPKEKEPDRNYNAFY